MRALLPALCPVSHPYLTSCVASDNYCSVSQSFLIFHHCRDRHRSFVCSSHLVRACVCVCVEFAVHLPAACRQRSQSCKCRFHHFAGQCCGCGVCCRPSLGYVIRARQSTSTCMFSLVLSLPCACSPPLLLFCLYLVLFRYSFYHHHQVEMRQQLHTTPQCSHAFDVLWRFLHPDVCRCCSDDSSCAELRSGVAARA